MPGSPHRYWISVFVGRNFVGLVHPDWIKPMLSLLARYYYRPEQMKLVPSRTPLSQRLTNAAYLRLGYQPIQMRDKKTGAVYLAGLVYNEQVRASDQAMPTNWMTASR